MTDSIDYDPRKDDSDVLDALSRLPDTGPTYVLATVATLLNIPEERVAIALYRIQQGGFVVPLPPLTAALIADALAQARDALAPFASIDAVNNDDPTAGREEWLDDTVRCGAIWNARDALARIDGVRQQLAEHHSPQPITDRAGFAARVEAALRANDDLSRRITASLVGRRITDVNAELLSAKGDWSIAIDFDDGSHLAASGELWAAGPFGRLVRRAGGRVAPAIQQRR